MTQGGSRRGGKKRGKKRKLAPFPDGPFDLIYADPPWDYESGWVTPSQGGMTYPTMTDDEICAMPVREIAGDSSVLMMWCTWRKLAAGIRAMEAWGFRYVTGVFVWLKTYKKPRLIVPIGKLQTGEELCKLVETDDYRTLISNEVAVRPVCGMGKYTKTSTEFVLLGVRGKWAGVGDKAINQTVIEEHQRKHSKKPKRVYELIEKLYPGRKKIELFARGKAHEEWVTWGDQAKKTRQRRTASAVPDAKKTRRSPTVSANSDADMAMRRVLGPQVKMKALGEALTERVRQRDQVGMTIDDLRELVALHGSASALARAAMIEPATISRCLSGKRSLTAASVEKLRAAKQRLQNDTGRKSDVAEMAQAPSATGDV